MAKTKKKLTRLQKLLLTAMSLALVLGLTVGMTIAFVLTNTEALENTFVPAVVEISTQENYDSDANAYSSFTVVNSGSNIPVYIRVAVVANWRNTGGNVCGGEHDAAIPTITPGTDWVLEADGYYYYTKPVAVGAATGNLLDGPLTMGTDADGCQTQFFFLASAIQAQGVKDGTGTPAYKDAWEQAPTLN